MVKIVNDGTEQNTIIIDIRKTITLNPGEEIELDQDVVAIHLQ